MDARRTSEEPPLGLIGELPAPTAPWLAEGDLHGADIDLDRARQEDGEDQQADQNGLTADVRLRCQGHRKLLRRSGWLRDTTASKPWLTLKISNYRVNISLVVRLYQRDNVAGHRSETEPRG